MWLQAIQKISGTEGGFLGALEFDDRFGLAVASLGDLGGVPALAVGATGDDDGGNFRGAVWVLFLNPDGKVQSQQKISSTEGGFNGAEVDFNDQFGGALASLGDLGGDGGAALAVGAYGDDGFTGAVYILFLDPAGTVKGYT